MSKINIIERVTTLDDNIQKAIIEKTLLLEKAIQGGNVDTIFKAQRYLQGTNSNGNGSGMRGLYQSSTPTGSNQVGFKSLVLDPQAITSGGYVEKRQQISFEILRAMARTSIIKPIVETRKEQILDFFVPQKDKYSTGFVIRPKNAKKTDSGFKFSKEQETMIAKLTEFLLYCGDDPNRFHGDDLQSFGRKFMNDSLTLDQATAEIIRTRKGDITEFIATDGASFRIADTFDPERLKAMDERKLQDGTAPFYVQLYQSAVHAEYYPWELIFGIRNPQSSMYAMNYGRSELEDLIETVTSLLNAEAYNANYFKVGSNPKGILRVNGNVNQARLEEFKTSWQASVAGVRNAHKMLIVESDKMDFVSTQQSNKDMEWGRYFELLIKIGCAHYKLDPSEINFPLSGSTEQKAMFEGNNEARLKHSKDKGLKPILKQNQVWLNKYIIGPKSNYQYELTFEGLDAETPEQELENDIKAIQNWSTVNEIRRKRGMKDIEGGDIILNPIMMQQAMMQQQQQMQGQQQGGQGQDSNAFMNDQYGGEDEDENSNPFLKALSEDINKAFVN